MIKVLYLDDSRIALKMLTQSLKGFAEMHCVTTVAKALIEIEDHTFDAFIIDYQLSGECGFDLVELLRIKDIYRETPIFLISASLTEEMAYGGMKRGVNFSFRKPIPDFNEFKERVLAQIEKPFIELVVREKININCLRWQDKGMYYEFSPELRKLVSGKSKKITNDKMLEVMKENESSALGEIYDVEIVQHSIKNHNFK
jgi:CheY-like chemotaxis protein